MRTRSHQPLPNLLGALTLLLSFPAAADAGGSERWQVVSIADRPVGSVHEVETRHGDTITTSETMHIALNRMGSSVEMTTTTIWTETLDGRLRELEFLLDMSERETRLRAVVAGDRIHVAQDAGGQSFASVVELEPATAGPSAGPSGAPLLGPLGARRLSGRELEGVGDAVTYRVFHPMLAAVAETTRRALHVDADGTRVVEERTSGIPIATTLRLDPASRIVGSEMPGPFGTIRTVLADRAAARLADSGGELPEESYGASLLHTRRRLPTPRQADWMQLELRHRNPALGWPDLASDSQKVLERSDDRLLVAVSRRYPSTTAALPVEASAATRPYLSASAYLRSDSDEARRLAAEILGDERDVFAAGLALERWVAENMTFDMGIVMAPSDEVLENRRGTCTEYAVLLTTLARAAGIPARFVMGYVYVNGIFGGHAWTEILVGEEWIGLDAAVVTEGPADAARLAFQWTALEEGAGRLNVGPATQMYGQVDVEVLGYRLEGRPAIAFDAGEETVRVTDDLFVDTGLGIAWSRPEGFEFADYALTWPERTLVALEGADGGRAEIQVSPIFYWRPPDEQAWERLESLVPEGRRGATILDGRPAFVVSDTGRLAAAVADQEELWILTVEGHDPEGLLERVAAGLDLPWGEPRR